MHTQAHTETHTPTNLPYSGTHSQQAHREGEEEKSNELTNTSHIRRTRLTLRDHRQSDVCHIAHLLPRSKVIVKDIVACLTRVPPFVSLLDVPKDQSAAIVLVLAATLAVCDGGSWHTGRFTVQGHRLSLLDGPVLRPLSP